MQTTGTSFNTASFFVSVVNVSVGDNVNEFAYLKSAYLGKHMKKDTVLNNVPVVCNDHIVGALI